MPIRAHELMGVTVYTAYWALMGSMMALLGAYPPLGLPGLEKHVKQPGVCKTKRPNASKTSSKRQLFAILLEVQVNSLTLQQGSKCTNNTCLRA